MAPARSALLLAAALGAAHPGGAAAQGTVQAVYDLVERVIPTASAHFALSLSAAPPCASAPGVAPGAACFTLSDAPGGRVAVAATSASELSAGVGVYLREFCNMTIGWPRGGGSRVFLPSVWPAVGGTPVSRARVAKYSYIENVCTHSYSLAWYDWPAWSNFIDWMALSGVNFALAMTGQEEVQYKVFSALGLDDLTIRSWFNGPALLTWSRGQNEYGNNIAGPLPRSFMRDQWNLQKRILARYRELNIDFQLPGFQANVPWALAAVLGDANITQQGDTGWMYSTDPQFARIADLWMQTLCADFGCSPTQPMQLDGYFDGGTAPWKIQGVGDSVPPRGKALPSPPAANQPPPQPRSLAGAATALPACVFSAAQPNTYLAGCDATNCAAYGTLADAQAACLADVTCGGVTQSAGGKAHYELRQGDVPQTSPDGETSWYVTNAAACRPPPPPVTPDPVWRERAVAAYAGLTRTVPNATWYFQGWAIVHWTTWQQASQFSGFVDAVPHGRFVVTDMSEDGSGEWRQWSNAGLFGAPFVWTTLHDFGGTDALKGNLSRANEIPWAFAASGGDASQVMGTGYTPEGIDQNPAYYELVMEAHWRTGPIADIPTHMVTRSHRRYGLTAYSPDVAAAWTGLVASVYSQDVGVQDPTGIAHLPGSASQFEADRHTPTPLLCTTWASWGHLLAAAPLIDMANNEPFRYDLINLGREVLAQLSTPVSMNFSDALNAAGPVNAAAVNATGSLYVELLNDIDTLVATDSAFLLGPWVAAAIGLANGTDCNAGASPTNPGTPMDCGAFMAWNSLVQITTWNPVSKGATTIPDGPVDYASKHWSGLISDYYAARAAGILRQALADAAAGKPLDKAAVEAWKASHAYTFQNAYPPTYPLTPTGDPVAVSTAMRAKWARFFAPTCGA